MTHKGCLASVVALAGLALLPALLRWSRSTTLVQALRASDHGLIVALLPKGPLKDLWVEIDVAAARRYLESPFTGASDEALARMRLIAAVSGDGRLFAAVLANAGHRPVSNVACVVAMSMLADARATAGDADVRLAWRSAPWQLALCVTASWCASRFAGPASGR